MAGIHDHARTAGLSGADAKGTPRARAPARRPAAERKPAARPRAGKAAAAPRHVRWWAVTAVVAAVLIGLPLAHAFVGELGAVLLGTFLGGFALGRATGKR